MTPNDQYSLLVHSLQFAAASAEDQIASLPGFAAPEDELINTFYDSYLLVPQLVRAGLVSKVAEEELQKLDEYLSHAPDDIDTQQTDCLRNSPYWAAARRLAQSALAALNEPLVAPQKFSEDS